MMDASYLVKLAALLDKPWRGEALDLIAGIWAMDGPHGP
jgi:hypothetical protein